LHSRWKRSVSVAPSHYFVLVIRWCIIRQISWRLRFSYDSSRIIRMKISPQGIRRFSTCRCSINIWRQLWMNHFSIYCFNSIYNMSQCICIQFSSVFKITLQNSNEFETTHWTLSPSLQLVRFITRFHPLSGRQQADINHLLEQHELFPSIRSKPQSWQT